MAPVYAVQVGWARYVTNELARTIYTAPVARKWVINLYNFTVGNFSRYLYRHWLSQMKFAWRFANAKTRIRNYVIPGRDNVPVRWDGTAKLAVGHVRFTRLARIARITVIARTTRSARPSTALAFAPPDTEGKTVASCARKIHSAKIARKRAPARMELAVRLRMDVATAQLVSW